MNFKNLEKPEKIKSLKDQIIESPQETQARLQKAYEDGNLSSDDNIPSNIYFEINTGNLSYILYRRYNSDPNHEDNKKDSFYLAIDTIHYPDIPRSIIKLKSFKFENIPYTNYEDETQTLTRKSFTYIVFNEENTEDRGSQHFIREFNIKDCEKSSREEKLNKLKKQIENLYLTGCLSEKVDFIPNGTIFQFSTKTGTEYYLTKNNDGQYSLLSRRKDGTEKDTILTDFAFILLDDGSISFEYKKRQQTEITATSDIVDFKVITDYSEIK